ncbi:hypothetical protein EVAR_36690_1 [Eumeta japonica]|uniref:Uncharacterized protein n=1 Tax=Eumeta variegata TaxID=151549 RepID=A0A4C1XPL8_EUMVA|nr:hypothetical protein EVAR_36690_1 [Eumeta japonica]
MPLESADISLLYKSHPKTSFHWNLSMDSPQTHRRDRYGKLARRTLAETPKLSLNIKAKLCSTRYLLGIGGQEKYRRKLVPPDDTGTRRTPRELNHGRCGLRGLFLPYELKKKRGCSTKSTDDDIFLRFLPQGGEFLSVVDRRRGLFPLRLLTIGFVIWLNLGALGQPLSLHMRAYTSHIVALRDYVLLGDRNFGQRGALLGASFFVRDLHRDAGNSVYFRKLINNFFGIVGFVQNQSVSFVMLCHLFAELQ